MTRTTLAPDFASLWGAVFSVASFLTTTGFVSRTGWTRSTGRG